MVLVYPEASMMQQPGREHDYRKNMLAYYLMVSGFGQILRIHFSLGCVHHIKGK